MRFDPSADPWGVVMLVGVGLAAFALLWGLVALMLRTSARGAFVLIGFAAFVYLGGAAGGTAARVMATPPAPPPAPPPGPARVIKAEVPPDPDARPSKAPARTPAAPTPTPSEPPPAEPSGPPPAEPPPAALPSPPPSEPVAAPTPEPASPPATEAAAPVVLAAPTLHGRAALKFVDDVSHDPRKCVDADAVAAALRELPGMLDEVSRSRADKAAFKLEQCRRKLVFARSYTIRKHRVGDREAFADALPQRLSAQGLTVLVTLRGAAHERIRIGGAGLDEARAKALLDGGLRDELADHGFVTATLANMKGALDERFEVPTDQELAARELAPLGLDRPVALPPS